MAENDNKEAVGKLSAVISSLQDINKTVSDSAVELFVGIDDSLKSLATAFDESVSKLQTAFNTIPMPLPAVATPALPAPPPMPKVAESAPIGVGSILGANDKSNIFTALAFARIQKKLLKNIEKNLPTEFEFDTKLSLSTLLGQNESQGFFTAFAFARLKYSLINNIRKSIPKQFDWSQSLDIATLLGQNDKDSFLTAFAFARLKRRLISAIKANIPEEFAFNKDLTIGDVFGTLPEADFLFQLRLAKLRHDILSVISKSVRGGSEKPTVASGGSSVEMERAGPEASDTPGILQKLLEVTQIGFAANEVLLEQLIAFFRGDSLQQREDSNENASLMQKLLKASQAAGVSGAPGQTAGAAGGGGGFFATLGKIGPVLASLGKGLAIFGRGVGRGIGKFVEEVLRGLGRGLRYISNPRLLIGVAVLAAIGGAMYIAAKGFQQFTNISWKDVLIGSGVLLVVAGALALLGKFAGQMLIGAAALLVISAAIGLAGIAFQQFGGIKWKDVAIGLGVLALVGVVAAVLAPAAPVLLIGALAIAALGAAMIPAATAFLIFGKATEFVATSFSSVSDSIVKLASVDGNALLTTAKGLVAIGGALAVFAGGTFLAGLSSFFSADPVKPFERFAAISQSLGNAASAITSITGALDQFDSKMVKELGDGLVYLAKSVSSDAFTDSNLMYVFNQFKPLGDSIEKASNGMNSFVTGFGNLFSMTSGDNVASFDLFIAKVYELSAAISELALSFGSIDGYKLAALSPGIQNQTPMTVQPAMAGISPSIPAITGEQLHYGTIENESMKEANRANSIAMPIVAKGGPKMSSVKNTSVTYNVANHVDQTMQKVIFDNRF